MISKRVWSHNGWTAIELMIVIAVMGILSAFAIPGFMKGMPLRKLKADAMDLTSNMKYAKMKAVQRNVQVGLYFNSGSTTVNGVDPGAYCVYEDTGSTANQFDTTDTQLKGNISLRGGIQFDSVNWTINDNTVVFRQNGSASKAGTVIITNGSETRNVVIHPITGRVRIQ